MRKPLTLSIIIPVYNEEDYIVPCLDSIAAQTVQPYEVIVVDNNCTDATVTLAKQYPFVKVIKEPRQHQAFGQFSGFDTATGDILGRIDADTILPEDWAANILEHFRKRPVTAAVTGSGVPYDVCVPRVGTFMLDGFFKLASFWAGHKLVWGANCAIRAKVWRQIRSDMLLRSDIWEDYDLALCSADYGHIDKLTNIDVGASFRAVHRPFGKQMQYQIRSVRTFALQRGVVTASAFAACWVGVSLLYPLALIDKYVLRPTLRTSEEESF